MTLPRLLQAPWRARIVLLAAVLGVALTARLGLWQLSRAAEKEAMLSALATRSAMPPLPAAELARTPGEAAAQHYRRTTLGGRWIDAHTVYLENRPMDGRVGFIVVTPLQLEPGGDAVLVQRGWVPRDAADRTRLPPLPQVPGLVEVQGLIAPPPGRLLELAGEPAGPIRQNLDLDAFGRESRLTLRPVTVQQAATPGLEGDGLSRRWPPPVVDVQKHLGYAFQWFAMATLITGLYVWFQLVRPRLRRRA